METIFEEVRLRLETDEKLVKKVNGVYEFKIHRKDGLTQFWTMDLTSFPGSISEGPNANAKCRVELSEFTFLEIGKGESDGQSAFMQGKLKLNGNMGMAMKLNEIIGSERRFSKL